MGNPVRRRGHGVRGQAVRRLALVAATAVLVTGCTSAASSSGASPSPAPAVTASGCLLGLAAPAGGAGAFTAATGAHPDVLAQYAQPQDRLVIPPAGVMPLLSLATTQPPVQVLAGADDDALTRLGQEIAAYERPVVVSIDPEANGPWYSYGTRKASPAQYVALYRHVHDVLQQAGARNVTWAWTISNSPPITHPSLLRSLYPGEAYVDWIGIDGYFIGSEDSWQQVFGRVLGEVRQFTGKPFLITETSVQSGPQAAQWVRELFAGVESTPGIVGFVWFDYDKAAENRDDWRIEDDPAALAAFRAAIRQYGEGS